MGTDITIYFEALQDDGKWVSTDNWEVEYGELDISYSNRVYTGRNYQLFAMLANVRNSDEIVPFAEPRGVPGDCDKRIAAILGDDDDYWSISHFTLAELLSFDWSQQVTMQVFAQLYNWWDWQDNLTRNIHSLPKSYCRGTNSTIISETQARELCAAVDAEYDTFEDVKKELSVDRWRTYVDCKWTRPYYMMASGFWGSVIPHMLGLGKPDNVRMVFCFG